jgi:hypothetical protein
LEQVRDLECAEDMFCFEIRLQGDEFAMKLKVSPNLTFFFFLRCPVRLVASPPYAIANLLCDCVADCAHISPFLSISPSAKVETLLQKNEWVRQLSALKEATAQRPSITITSKTPSIYHLTSSPLS